MKKIILLGLVFVLALSPIAVKADDGWLEDFSAGIQEILDDIASLYNIADDHEARIELLEYSSGSGGGSGSIGTGLILVAASNAPVKIKAAADYVCDGVDDQYELNLAFGESEVLNEEVKLSGGCFYISAPLNLKSWGVIRGAGMEATRIYNEADDHCFVGDGNTRYVRIQDLSIRNDYSGDRTKGDAIHISPKTNTPIVFLENMRIGGHYDNVYVGHPIISKISHVIAFSSVRRNFYITGTATSTTVDNCYSCSAGEIGFYLEWFVYSSLLNCASDDSGSHGYYFYANRGTSVISCGAESNGGDGFCFSSSTSMSINGAYTAANVNGVHVTDTGAVTITGLRSESDDVGVRISRNAKVLLFGNYYVNPITAGIVGHPSVEY